MSKEIIFKTFRTYSHPYVYDRQTNAVVMLSENEYQELLRVEKGELDPELSQFVKSHQNFGLFSPNSVETIEHSGSMKIGQYLKSRMKQLTLQVTQQCNLRCEYCVYSGNYNGQRTHSSQRMGRATAIKAIDFFLERSNELAEVTIGFYGGEPLLEFDLIRECVEYAKNQVEGKRIKFNITTNGTLLTDTIVDFFVENDFILCISLDGSKSEHDANRKFLNGEGSFDTILANIRRILERHPRYYEQIMFLTTINPHVDLACVMEYFSTDEIFGDRNIMFNEMSEFTYDGEISYEQSYYGTRNFEYIKMLFSLVGKLENKYVSPLVNRTREAIIKRQKRFQSRAQLSTIAHHGGPCLAGVMRLFVRADGALFPCERVGEMLDFFMIGTLENGLDIQKIKKVINIGKLTENECKNCWCLRQCTHCAGQINFDTVLTKEDKQRICPQSLSASLFELKEHCVLNEFGFDPDRMR